MYLMGLFSIYLAERVGFEPTYRLITDNSISSRARYGLFATFPQTCVIHELTDSGKPFFRRTAGRPQASVSRPKAGLFSPGYTGMVRRSSMSA